MTSIMKSNNARKIIKDFCVENAVHFTCIELDKLILFLTHNPSSSLHSLTDKLMFGCVDAYFDPPVASTYQKYTVSQDADMNRPKGSLSQPSSEAEDLHVYLSRTAGGKKTSI